MLLPDGRVVFVPSKTANIGLYDPVINKFTPGPSAGDAGSSDFKYTGGVLLSDGRVVFVPWSTSNMAPRTTANIGLYEPATNKFTSGPSAGSGGLYQGGVLLLDGRVVFVPTNSHVLGLYEPALYNDQPAYVLAHRLMASWSTALLPYYNKI